MGGYGSGKKPIYFDEFHIGLREYNREYYERNRDVVNLGHRLKIGRKRARKLLRHHTMKEFTEIMRKPTGKEELLRMLAEIEKKEEEEREKAKKGW